MTWNGFDEMNAPTSLRRRRSGVVRSLIILVLLALSSLACAANTVTTSAESVAGAPDATSVEIPVVATAEPATVEPATVEPAPSPEPTPTPHPIAVADTELPAAPIGFDDLFDTEPVGPRPVSMEIENIRVADAAIIPVGVNQDQTFEVPPADQIGWYEFGSSPGEAGSAVLAAHIAYNGVDGVFRYLEDVEIGSIVVIGFDDGTTSRYRIEEVTEYVKEALPDSLFAREGKEQLALITCGGTFNYDLDSYESNTVAIAVPI